MVNKKEDKLEKTKEIPEQARERFTQLQTNLIRIQTDFQTYAEGVKDGLGLKGQYNLDIKNWVFVKVEEKTEDAPEP